MNKGLLFVVSAPSGTGKSTLLKAVMEKLNGLVFSISHTTRKPRPNELNGTHYHFVDTSTFEAMIQEDAFLEWARVYSNMYGTSKQSVDELLRQGKDVILEIDAQGADNIRKNCNYTSIGIFIAPPSMLEMEQRLRRRGTEEEKELALRLKEAGEEMKKAGDFDYLVVNDQLHDATDMVCSIICAERARARRNQYGLPIRIDA